MDVNTEALNTIRVIRAQLDPVPVLNSLEEDKPTCNFTEPHPVAVHERFDKVSSRPLDTPRRRATWGDTAIHLQRLSLNNSIVTRKYNLALATVKSSKEFFKFANIDFPKLQLVPENVFDQDLETLEEQFKHSEIDPSEFDEGVVDRTIDTIRRGIAIQQHEFFAELIYPELPEALTDGVPRVFWKQPDPKYSPDQIFAPDAERDNKGGTSEDQRQTGLGDF